ncbi:hypothetical protein PINS_up011924 [Pythium insidiosum]|nr:hypothetical protein PINS_up011924 [Pythium insidiosum]
MIIESNSNLCVGPSRDDGLEFQDRKPQTYQAAIHNASIIPLGSNHGESAIQVDEESAPPCGCEWYSCSNSAGGDFNGGGTNAEKSPANSQYRDRVKKSTATSSTHRRSRMTPEERQRRHREAQRQFIKRKQEHVARMHCMVRVYERLVQYTHLIVQSRQLKEERRRLQLTLAMTQREVHLQLYLQRQRTRSSWSIALENDAELPWSEILQCLEE